MLMILEIILNKNVTSSHPHGTSMVRMVSGTLMLRCVTAGWRRNTHRTGDVRMVARWAIIIQYSLTSWNTNVRRWSQMERLKFISSKIDDTVGNTTRIWLRRRQKQHVRSGNFAQTALMHRNPICEWSRIGPMQCANWQAWLLEESRAGCTPKGCCKGIVAELEVGMM